VHDLADLGRSRNLTGIHGEQRCCLVQPLDGSRQSQRFVFYYAMVTS